MPVALHPARSVLEQGPRSQSRRSSCSLRCIQSSTALRSSGCLPSVGTAATTCGTCSGRSRRPATSSGSPCCASPRRVSRSTAPWCARAPHLSRCSPRRRVGDLVAPAGVLDRHREGPRRLRLAEPPHHGAEPLEPAARPAGAPAHGRVEPGRDVLHRRHLRRRRALDGYRPFAPGLRAPQSRRVVHEGAVPGARPQDAPRPAPRLRRDVGRRAVRHTPRVRPELLRSGPARGDPRSRWTAPGRRRAPRRHLEGDRVAARCGEARGRRAARDHRAAVSSDPALGHQRGGGGVGRVLRDRGRPPVEEPPGGCVRRSPVRIRDATPSSRRPRRRTSRSSSTATP